MHVTVNEPISTSFLLFNAFSEQARYRDAVNPISISVFVAGQGGSRNFRLPVIPLSFTFYVGQEGKFIAPSFITRGCSSFRCRLKFNAADVAAHVKSARPTETYGRIVVY